MPAISIHALREEGDLNVCFRDALRKISIHALREEGDQLWGRRTRPLRDFYPRPPRGGRRRRARQCRCIYKFLSTPSARRATLRGGIAVPAAAYFYPRPPRGGRRPGGVRCPPCKPISIHALREEGDAGVQAYESTHTDFYPRPPRGGRLPRRWPSTPPCRFLSTPSARRATRIRALPVSREIDFYPRPPRGGRLRRSGLLPRLPEFLSTPSARRATPALGVPAAPQGFLSTPSARRATSTAGIPDHLHGDFYPRPPRGGRRTIPVFSPGV